MKFAKPQVYGSLGTIQQTYYEMGSTQSRPCLYKSSEVTAMETVYTKKGSQFRANQVPQYGPVGVNSCLQPGDRPYENYSMLKNYESLSLAQKYCNMYQDCDIIVEIDRTQGKKLVLRVPAGVEILFKLIYLVANWSLQKLYEIGNTRSRNKCKPRPQPGVRISRISFNPNLYRNIPTFTQSQPAQRPNSGNQGPG